MTNKEEVPSKLHEEMVFPARISEEYTYNLTLAEVIKVYDINPSDPKVESLIAVLQQDDAVGAHLRTMTALQVLQSKAVKNNLSEIF